MIALPKEVPGCVKCQKRFCPLECTHFHKQKNYVLDKKRILISNLRVKGFDPDTEQGWADIFDIPKDDQDFPNEDLSWLYGQVIDKIR